MASGLEFEIVSGTTNWASTRNTQLAALVTYLDNQELSLSDLQDEHDDLQDDFDAHISALSTDSHPATAITLAVDPFGADATVENVMEAMRTALQWNVDIPTIVAGECSTDFPEGTLDCVEIQITLSDETKKAFIETLGGFISVLVTFYDDSTPRITRSSSWIKVFSYEESGDDIILTARFKYNSGDKNIIYAVGFGILSRGEYDYQVISSEIELPAYLEDIEDFVDYATLAEHIINNLGLSTDTQTVKVKVDDVETEVEMVTGISLTNKLSTS